MGGFDVAWAALFALLGVAAVCDLGSLRVPRWLTGGGITLGMLLAAWAGPPALRASLAGAAVGGLVFLPFVLRGQLGGADALLLAAVGAWLGWRVALWAAWWTTLPGAALALGVWAWRVWRARARHDAAACRAARAEPFPYVPAVLAGAALALLTAR